ncbi:hypothetical protein GOODEAATRI_000453 [Goodea atripinnis]|uniref:Uncharacterized protein n=1 Tax=Goodea atripinnis TaxID=208336 RepID=A0ABV0NGC1_9TELE
MPWYFKKFTVPCMLTVAFGGERGPQPHRSSTILNSRHKVVFPHTHPCLTDLEGLLLDLGLIRLKHVPPVKVLVEFTKIHLFAFVMVGFFQTSLPSLLVSVKDLVLHFIHVLN